MWARIVENPTVEEFFLVGLAKRSAGLSQRFRRAVSLPQFALQPLSADSINHSWCDDMIVPNRFEFEFDN
jgi:hypothetical protein